MTADSEGNFYAIVLSYVSTSQENGFYVFKSIDGGVSWGPPLEVINQYPDVFEDKELIACDRTGGAHAGNLYVTWTRFGWSTTIEFRRSIDAGEHWNETVRVSDDSSVQFPIPVVGRQGEVYVAWTSYAYEEILIDRSDNGGVSFGNDRTVAEVYTPSTVLNGGVDAYSSPHMDADLTDGPHGGRLYVAFMDRRNGSHDRDIWLTHSDDMGVNWTTPVRINDDPFDNGRDQFHPWLVVDNQGIVTIVFLDRRHDPQNRTYHCYLAQSFDGGLSWEPNIRVSTEPSDPQHADYLGGGPHAKPQISELRAGLLGEYIGVTAHDGRPTPIWTDIRNLHQDAFAGYLDDFSGLPDGEPGGGFDDERRSFSDRLRIWPNPLPAGVVPRVSWDSDAHRQDRATGSLRILDAGGRRMPSWEAAAPGVYWLQLCDPRGVASGRVLIIR